MAVFPFCGIYIVIAVKYVKFYSNNKKRTPFSSELYENERRKFKVINKFHNHQVIQALNSLQQHEDDLHTEI